ncbi:MAG: hypothetical protein HLUCCA05_01705 [Roseibaca calidilacus]|uniref:DUF2256 domain-containing protein n=2 Tax=Roseibaca calidilacus TaxID=1666912 RepID=A0A0P7WCJ3_9RHOB|nr:MAG: hypothetical protein HLUCCA05_01705 [Roseibaca calidilacus]CUX82397.1 hypothetical protein Ga0058931_2350 [Roseibaca calidilacus]
MQPILTPVGARLCAFAKGMMMASHVKKGDLPSKTCATCGRPFTWRKKWAKVWDEVRYCSDRCRGMRKPQAPRPLR